MADWNAWSQTVETPGEARLGTRLIESIVRHQMGGRLTRRYEADGLFCEFVVRVSD